MLQILIPSQPDQIFSHPFSNILYRQGSQNKNAPRILILCRGILLDEMIASLLCDEPGLQILITPMDHEEVIAQAVVIEKPQTVVLCDSVDFSVDKLNQILEDLHYSEEVRIVVVALNENSLVVNSKKKHVYTNFRNLVHLIKNTGISFQ